MKLTKIMAFAQGCGWNVARSARGGAAGEVRCPQQCDNAKSFIDGPYECVRAFLLLAAVFVGMCPSFASDVGEDSAVNGVLTIEASGEYRLTSDFKQLVVQAPSAGGTIEVTVDMNGHSISNEEENVLVDVAKNKSAVTLTLTNSTAQTSYIDGLFKYHSWSSGADNSGRGIRNSATGTVHFGGDITIRRCHTNKGGSGIYNRGTFVMTGGSVGEAATTNETGYCIIGCSNAVSGAVFWYGAGVLNYDSKAVFRMTGGSICYCLNNGNFGGGIATCKDGAKALLGGTARVFCNRAKCGAGVMAGLKSELILTNDVMVCNNIAYGSNNYYSGGGVTVGLSGGLNKLVMYGGCIVSNIAEHIGGGGIYMRGVTSDETSEDAGYGEIYIYGGLIEGNRAEGPEGHGGGIYTKGLVQIEGGEIKGNSADGHGGGIYISDDPNGADKSFVMVGGRINGNSSGKDGGGVYAARQVSISGGSIDENAAGQNGGGVYIAESIYPFMMAGGLIANNVATNNGGGVAATLMAGKTVELTNGSITNNVSLRSGGGLWLSGMAELNSLSGTLEISGNRAFDGGGIYLTNTVLSATSGSIVSNAAVRGGGICLGVDSRAVFEDAIALSYNVATNLGGAVAMNANSALTINSGTFTGNEAQMGGGVHLVRGATMTYNGGTMSGNRAVVREGTATQTTAWHTGVDDVYPGVGGAVYVGAGDSDSQRTQFSCPGTSGLVSIFENFAEKAGNDIVVSGLNTKLDLPDEVIFNDVYRLTWYEDYYTDDTHYEGKHSLPYQAKRYADAFRNNEQVSVAPVDAEVADTYWCLTLGYGFHGIPPALWITDHFDAGKNHVHLQFEPDFQGGLPVSLAYWARQMDKENRIFTEWTSPEGTTTNAVQATLRAGYEACADGRIWITTPVPADASGATTHHCRIRINRAGE